MRVTFNWTDNERKMSAYVAEKAMEPTIRQMNLAIQQVSGKFVDCNIVSYQSTHVQGGTIMGNDPSTSVVNRYHQRWNMPNLFIIGASNFPQHAGYNPTGAVAAITYWSADAIINKYLKSPSMLT